MNWILGFIALGLARLAWRQHQSNKCLTATNESLVRTNNILRRQLREERDSLAYID